MNSSNNQTKNNRISDKKFNGSGNANGTGGTAGANTSENPQNLFGTDKNASVNFDKEESNCICVKPVPKSVSKEEIESYFTALSHQSHTKMPEEVQHISAFQTAYVVYPSVESARKVFDRVNGTISLDGVTCN